jgi:hypothetical protein
MTPAPQRAWGKAAAAGLLVLTCVAVGTTWAARADNTSTVLTAARPIAAGHQLTAEDLSTTRVGHVTVPVIAADRIAQAVGQTAAVDLIPGTLLAPAMLTSEATPGQGKAVVSAKLSAGAVPDEVTVGSHVRLFAMSDNAGGGQPVQTAAVPGRVLSMNVDSTDGSVRISLLVADTDAPAVVRAAASETVSVVLLDPSGQTP